MPQDDDDDPFFMPVPSALKLADASKFMELAKPIKEADSPFMIAMDGAWAGGQQRTWDPAVIQGPFKAGRVLASTCGLSPWYTNLLGRSHGWSWGMAEFH